MGDITSKPFFVRYFQRDHDDFPPDFGFKAPRKEKVMKITEQEMMALQIPTEERDYCAHLLKDVYMCKRDHAPFFSRCNHYFHAYFQCQVDEYIMGLKQIERNRRLKERQLKKQKMAELAAH